MVIYYSVEIIWRIIVTPEFFITYKTMIKHYPGKPVNIHIQLLISIIWDNNKVITTKKDKGKFPLFDGNGERVITIYGGDTI